ncbi:unnamed protein product [Somion occarium]|uniref:Enhancer of polycomb-like protein n=1 Tax=Somion occarium TaxID=3059160 RepID=A0ABP1DMR4_9APHY
MPRPHNAGPSTLRNRNRVTNKTRLKVIKESIDADPIVLDEDEEKARVVSTAGVDAEDAQEHHLQAVLTAAATRHQSIARSTRAATDKESLQPAAFIPTPDSTGIVDNYEELYPPSRWIDPTNYVKSSDTVEESISFALANGFIYYMDERDKEWLDRNNEEARGEGTSAQGAISGSTRSGRSSKAKGKDPEVSQPVAMSEDEFELVMAIFEKVTHEKTEFLHHGLEQGSAFPPFTDYQDVFMAELPPDMFALYQVPSWKPEPDKLTRIAKVVYPYWRERRLERGGHPIIPSVNMDTKNESYICFRRREIKAIRKTRAQQATYSDKLLRIKLDLEKAREMADLVNKREESKRESAVIGHSLWESRFRLVDLKRKHPSLGTKEDDELLHDKERVPKKVKTDTAGRPVVRLHTGSREPVIHQEPIMHPRARHELIQKQIESEMAKRKEKDHHWEDALDNPYQNTPTSFPSRLFKFIQASRPSPTLDASASTPPTSPSRQRAARLRFGRGGRILLDRRLPTPRLLLSSNPEEQAESKEDIRRLRERWRFDDDDAPAVGPEGPDEQDRKLVDDFSTPYLCYHMKLMTDQDHAMLNTDTSITVTTSEGRQQQIVPYRLGIPQPVRTREQSSVPSQRPAPSPTPATPSVSSLRHPNGTSMALSSSNGGTPVSVPAHLKSMPPPATVPSLRISANGGMRANTPSTSSASPTVPSQRPSQSPVRDMMHAHGTLEEPNGVVKHEQEVKMTVPSQVNGSEVSQADIIMSPAPIQASPVSAQMSPIPHKSPAQQHHSNPVPTVPNGHYIAAVNGYGAHVPAGTPYLHTGVRPNGLTAQQMQTLKAAGYPNLTGQGGSTQVGTMHMPIRPPTTYMTHPSADYNSQLAIARQLQQWQRQPVHLVDANGADSALATTLSPPMNPPRVPSSNGSRGVSLQRGLQSPGLQHTMGSPQGRASPANSHMVRLAPHSPSPHHLSPSLAAAQAQSSPTRPPQPTLPSPSLQPRQVVGSSGVGY